MTLKKRVEKCACVCMLGVGANCSSPPSILAQRETDLHFWLMLKRATKKGKDFLFFARVLLYIPGLSREAKIVVL